MNNGKGFAAHINSFREGLTNATNGHGSGQFGELISNLTSLRRGILDMSNDKRRNLDNDFGWPSTGALNPETYRDLYDRDAIANRVVNLMPKECWQVTPEVYEREKGEVATPFEKSWKALNESVAGSSWHGGETGTAVFAKLKLLDIMSGIASFGIMLIGLDDGKRLDEPAEGVVDKVVSGMAFNSRNRIVDSWMTEDEEKKLQAFDGKEKRPKPLSADEIIAVNAWRRQRGMLSIAVAKVAEETLNQRVANLRPDDGKDNPRSPKNMFSSYDTSQTQAQQWFGTQFGEPEKLAEKPGTTERKVTFLRVFDESVVQVTRWEASVLSPRFGQPVIYRVTFNDPRDQSGGSLGMPSTTAFVHWSRVLHVPSDERGSNDAVGNSRLKAVINDVLDIRKVRGSSPEGYYQSCFPILAFETHPQLGDDVDVDLADLRGQVENLVNSLQRSLLGKGGSWRTLPPAVVDPTPHVTAGIEAICIQKACPVRIFKGSERGELASSQDDSQWNDRIRERQNGHVTPVIIVPFIDRLILMGVLKAPEKPGENPKVPADELPPNDQAMGNDAPIDDQDAEKWQPSLKKPILKPTTNKRWVWNTRTNRIQLVNAAPPFPPKPKTPTPIGGEDGPSTSDDDTMAEGSLDETDQLEGTNPEEVTVDQEPGYKIDWPDLDSLGDMDRATIANTLTQALSAYVQSGAADMMPPFEYFTQVWQMDDDEAAMVVTAMEKHQEEVQQDQQALMDEQGFAMQAPEGFHDPENPELQPLGAGESLVHPKTGEIKAESSFDPPAGGASPFPPKGGGQGGFLSKKGKPPIGNAATLEDLGSLVWEQKLTFGDVTNVFCPTGEGGGVDSSCSPGGSAAATISKGDLKSELQRIKGDESMVVLKTPKGTAHKIRNEDDLREFLADGGALDKGQHGDFSETTKSGPVAIHTKAADADKFARENVESTPLTTEQSAAVEAYRTTKDCYDINNSLRGTGTIAQTWKQKLFGLSKNQQETMAHLDKVIAGSHTKTDMVVMRGMKLEHGKVEEMFQPGKSWTDNGFMSTTLASDVADRFSTTSLADHDRVVIATNLPKGSNAYHMPRKPGAYDEAEMVLPRGSRFTVEKVERIDGRTVKVHVKHIGVKANGSTS